MSTWIMWVDMMVCDVREDSVRDNEATTDFIEKYMISDKDRTCMLDIYCKVYKKLSI